MFTGLVAAVSRVVSKGAALQVERPATFADIAVGESIAVSGVCLTALPGPGPLRFDVSPETLRRSTLGALERGDLVNLERALAVGERFGGHIVSGHVDGVGEVVSITSEGGSHRVRIRAPRPLHRFIAQKGSIGVEGVSLTVNEVEDDIFGVNLIPHTWEVTTLGDLKVGSPVNLEIDMLARYLARWQETA